MSGVFLWESGSEPEVEKLIERVMEVADESSVYATAHLYHSRRATQREVRESGAFIN